MFLCVNALVKKNYKVVLSGLPLIWDWPRLACECPGASGWGMGWLWPSAGLGALNEAVNAWGLLKEVTIIFITSTTDWPQVKQPGGTQLCPLTENWTKDLPNTAPPIRTRPSFPSVSLSHQETSISLLSFFIREQTDWKPQPQKTNQSDHMDHSLV